MPNEIQNYAELENMTDKKIQVYITWNTPTAGTLNTEVMPGEVAEIVCGTNTGKFCHRSDGGGIGCPASHPFATIKSGDYFQLEENGQFSG